MEGRVIYSPYEIGQWLDDLAKQKPAGGYMLTQEMLDRAGPAPVPPFTPGSSAGLLDYFTAVKTIAVQADNRRDRALLRRKSLRESGKGQAEVDEAGAEASFWEMVSQWANQWAQ